MIITVGDEQKLFLNISQNLSASRPNADLKKILNKYKLAKNTRR